MENVMETIYLVDWIKDFVQMMTIDIERRLID